MKKGTGYARLNSSDCDPPFGFYPPGQGIVSTGREFTVGLSADITTAPPDRDARKYTPEQLWGLYEIAKDQVVPNAICRMLGLRQRSDLQIGRLHPEIQASMHNTRSEITEITRDKLGDLQITHLIDGILELRSPSLLDPAEAMAGAREKIALLLAAGAKLGLRWQGDGLMRSTFGTGTDTHNLRVEKDQEFYRVRADTTVLKARHVMLYEDEHAR